MNLKFSDVIDLTNLLDLYYVYSAVNNQYYVKPEFHELIDGVDRFMIINELIHRNHPKFDYLISRWQYLIDASSSELNNYLKKNTK